MMVELEKLRWIKVQLKGDKEDVPSIQFIVNEGEVQAIYDAFYRLHVDPGVNPHERNVAAEKPVPMERFEVGKVQRHAPCWWTTPNLGEKGHPDKRPGVSLLEFSWERTWFPPDD